MSVKVEVGQYRPVNKGALRAFFSLVIYPQGQKILDCKHFVNGDRQWFSFPSKEIVKEGQKPDYIPLISFMDKVYLEKLKASVMVELNKQGTNEASKIQASPLQDNAQFDWGEIPF